MVQNRGLQEDMIDASSETIERVGTTGQSREVTEMEGYDPSYRVGPAQSYQTDFAKVAAPDARESIGDNIRDLLPGLMKDGVDATTAGGVLSPGQGSGPAPTGDRNDPSFIVNSPATRVNTSQVALSISPTRIIYGANERLSVIIVNRDQNNALFVGSSSAVSENTGFVIDPGASMTMAISCELWGVSPAGAIVSVMEFLK